MSLLPSRSWRALQRSRRATCSSRRHSSSCCFSSSCCRMSVLRNSVGKKALCVQRCHDTFSWDSCYCLQELCGGFQAVIVGNIGSQNPAQCLGQLVCWGGALADNRSKRVLCLVGLDVAIYISDIVVNHNSQQPAVPR